MGRVCARGSVCPLRQHQRAWLVVHAADTCASPHLHLARSFHSAHNQHPSTVLPFTSSLPAGSTTNVTSTPGANLGRRTAETLPTVWAMGGLQGPQARE